jgi:hypothetical protein
MNYEGSLTEKLADANRWCSVKTRNLKPKPVMCWSKSTPPPHRTQAARNQMFK